jgi:hypothetical protein
MTQANQQSLLDRVRAIKASIVDGKLQFDDPLQDAEWKATLAKTNEQLGRERQNTATTSLDNAARANALDIQHQGSLTDLRLKEGRGQLDLREKKGAIDSNAYARDMETYAGLRKGILDQYNQQIAGLDQSMTDRHNSSIAYFDRNDERREGLERKKLVNDMILNILRGAAIFAL